MPVLPVAAILSGRPSLCLLVGEVMFVRAPYPLSPPSLIFIKFSYCAAILASLSGGGLLRLFAKFFDLLPSCMVVFGFPLVALPSGLF